MQSKPPYFRGHCWGAISLLIGSLAQPSGLPLALSIHQGLIHFGQQNKAEGNVETLGTRMDLFDDLHVFSKMNCRIYGKVEEVSIMAMNLLWKPTGRMIRLVLAVTSRER